jgi:hypothetical protein
VKQQQLLLLLLLSLGRTTWNACSCAAWHAQGEAHGSCLWSSQGQSVAWQSQTSCAVSEASVPWRL